MKISITILLMVGIIFSITWFGYYKNHRKPVDVKSFIYTNAKKDNIVVDLPYPDAVVGKEFSIIGKARGNWYFEGSFPVYVLGSKGEILYQGVAQANGEWMTTDFVPFKVDIKVPESYIGQVDVVLKRDNPSGLSQNDASLTFKINIEY